MSKRIKTANRRDAATYFGLPHAVMDCPNYLNLSNKAVRLLNDIGRQYNGYNNGDLCATYSIMQKRSWCSKSSLAEALKELEYYGFIIKSRQGGRHKPSLYAITWQAVNECKGKLDIASTTTSPGDWKKKRPIYISKKQSEK